MTVKALRKQLMAAIAMVVVAAVALSSSTYAWFANNNKVTATGMQVTAMSNQAYLLISSTKTTAAEIQTENATTVALTVSDEEAKVFPAAHETIANTESADTVSNWYTGYSNNPGSVAMDNGTRTELTVFDNHVIHKTVYVTVAKNSDPIKDLKARATITANNSKTITQAKVLVTSSSASTELSSGTMSSEVVLSNGNITDATVLQLDIYIYIDGNDTAVYTNNIDKLDTAQITLIFEGTQTKDTV